MVSSLYYIISGGLVLLGIILFFVMSSRRGYRSEPKVDIPENEHIEHYTEIRDEVTVRKPRRKKEVVEEEESSGGFSLVSLAVSLVGVSIVFMVGLTVLNTVSSSLCDQSMNVSYGDTMTQNMIGSCVDGKATDGAFNTIVPIMVIIGFVFVLLSAFDLMNRSA